MSANAIMILGLTFVAGLVLGAFYFVSLWQTVRRLSGRSSPVKVLLISFVLRLSVLLGALYFVMDGRWERLAAAMLGFFIMRKILTHHLGPQEEIPAT